MNRIGKIGLQLQQLTEPVECYFCETLVMQAVACVDGIKVCARCANVEAPAQPVITALYTPSPDEAFAAVAN